MYPPWSNVCTAYSITIQVDPYPLHPGHMSLQGTINMLIEYFSKCRPAGGIRGSNPWVGKKNLAGKGDPTRGNDLFLTGHSESHGLGPVGSCQEGFKISSVRSRVGLGQEILKSHWSDRVRSGG